MLRSRRPATSSAPHRGLRAIGDRLGVSSNTAQKLCAAGAIDAAKIGEVWTLTEDAAQRAIRRGTATHDGRDAGLWRGPESWLASSTIVT